MEDKPRYIQDAIKICAKYKIDIYTSDLKVGRTAFANVNLNRITFYTEHEYWRNYAQDQIDEYNWGHFSTASPDHVVRHEIGHILLGRKIGADRFWDLISFDKDVNVDKIRKEVSNYAGKNPAEFHAEVFAGLWDGREYSKEIMDLYKSIEEGK